MRKSLDCGKNGTLNDPAHPFDGATEIPGLHSEVGHAPLFTLCLPKISPRMNPSKPSEERPKSRFAQKLESDPELCSRFSASVKALQEAGKEQIQAVEHSERLTSEDFAVYINARADNSLPDVE